MSSKASVTVHFYDDLVSRRNHRDQLLDLERPFGGTTGVELVEQLRAIYDGKALVILRNGRPVTPGELADTDVDEGDVFHVAPGPRDATTGVLIAIAIASAAASAYMVSSIKMPRATQTADGAEKRYGFGRFANEARAGDPIPVPYGYRPRHGGKVVATVPIESTDGSGNSKLHMLINVGHGEVESIAGRTADFDRATGESFGTGGIFLNDQPISGFPGCFVSGRLGSNSQEVIPGFADVETLREVGVGGAALVNTSGVEYTGGSASAEAFSFTTINEVNAVRVRVRFPGGLYRVGGSGQVDARRVKYRHRWRLTTGPGAWSAWTVVSLERADQSEFFSSPRLDLFGGVPARVDVQLERVTVDATSATDVDAMRWDSVVEIAYSDQDYAGFGMLAIELTAGEQLTGVPRVSFELKGRKVRVWDGNSPVTAPVFETEYSENPAWIALDLLTSTTYGLGASYQDDDIDFPSLIAWAEYCDELVDRYSDIVPPPQRPRFRFHYVLDEQRDGIEWLRAVCRAGRCAPVTSGGVWRFIVDKPQDPVEVFGDGSIAVDENGDARISYRREYSLGGLTRPNQLVCQFENAFADGQPETFAHPQPGQLWLGAPLNETIRQETIRFDGVTDPDQVLAELVYMMDRTRFLTRTVRFTTTRPVVVVQPGDRFDLATSLVGYAEASGRLAEGCTEMAVRLDRTVTLAPGTVYVVEVLYADGSRVARTVGAAAGTYAAGSSIDLSSALTSAPPEFTEYVLGRQNVVTKPFTCTAVRLVDAAKLEWEIEGLEYDDEVYDLIPGNVFMPDYSGLGSIFTPPGPVLDLRGHERTINAIHQIVLSWSQTPADAIITGSFRIYRRRLGTTTWIITPNASVAYRGAVLELAEQDVAYQFCVVAVSIAGAALSPYDPRVPIVTVIYGLALEPPPPPTGVTLTNTGGNTYTLSWNAVDGAVGYIVQSKGFSPDGGGAGWGVGIRDALTVARVDGTSLAGLELPAAQNTVFWVRSIAENGRMSWTGTAAAVTAATPPGETLKQNTLFNSGSSLTLTNCSWVTVGGTPRLRPTLPDSDAVMLIPEQDPGSLTLTELCLQPCTINDWLDPVLSSNPFVLPSIAADQWGVYADRSVGMILPPWPDEEQTWLFEVRTHDGTAWSAWQALAIGQSIRRTFQKWQARVTMRRAHAPYRPALQSLRAVLTH